MTKTIYFVHDQQGSPAGRKRVLEEGGYRVEMMTSSIELLIALKEKGQSPDAVLMDVLIEGRNGFEAVRELEMRAPGRTFPVLLCSRIYRARAFREEARRSGAQDYILLPVSSQELVSRIDQAIEQFDERPGPLPSPKPAEEPVVEETEAAELAEDL